jgi:dolichol-phosphate mannosyltransferase
MPGIFKNGSFVLMSEARTESLTIVIPVYNEEESLDFLTFQLKRFLNITPVDTTVLWVDDGSTDHSCEKIEKVCSNDSRFSYIFLEKNGGLSAALKAGFDASHSTLIGYMDADAQTLPMDFLRLLEYAPWYGLVMGIRENRKDSLIKRITSRWANRIRQWILGDGIKDSGCPLKVMKAEVAHRLPFFNGMHRFIPALVMMQGAGVKQVPIHHFKRYAGESKFSTWNRLIGPFFSMLFVRWMKNHYVHYSIRQKHSFYAEAE